jgi:hypothetical protein
LTGPVVGAVTYIVDLCAHLQQKLNREVYLALQARVYDREEVQRKRKWVEKKSSEMGVSYEWNGPETLVGTYGSDFRGRKNTGDVD